MGTLEIVLTTICVVLAVLFIVARVMKGGIGALLLKTLASFGFVASAVIGLVVSDTTGVTKWAIGLIVIGLLCGMIGDIVLDLKVIYPDSDKFYLNSGMLSFFVGHVFYIIAFSLLTDSEITIVIPILISIASAIAITLFITLSSGKMGLNFGKFKVQTIAYTFILSFSVVYALVLSIMGANLWIAFVGMVLFFLSDVVLSFQYFGGKLSSKPLIVINHALYYLAQINLVIFSFCVKDLIMISCY